MPQVPLRPNRPWHEVSRHKLPSQALAVSFEEQPIRSGRSMKSRKGSSTASLVAQLGSLNPEVKPPKQQPCDVLLQINLCLKKLEQRATIGTRSQVQPVPNRLLPPPHRCQ